MPNFTQASEILEARNKVYDQIETILKSESITAEDFTKVDALKLEAQQLTTRHDTLAEITKGRSEALNAIKPTPETPEFKFNTMGEFFLEVFKAGRANTYDKSKLTYFADESPNERKDLNEGIGADGGFLVPPEHRTNLLSVMTENTIVRSRATIIPMARREVNIPVVDQSGTTAGENHAFGGINVFWQEEASEKSQSDPSFRQIKLVAHKMVGYTRASDELLADSAVSLEAFLTGNMGFRGAMAWKEDYSFLNGNGVGQPLGILNSPGTLTVAREEQGDVTYVDLVNMMAKFYSPSNRGVWVASQSLKAKLMTMNGPAGFPQYLWGNAVSGQPNTLLGLPIVFTLNQLPLNTTTSTGDLMLADFDMYLIGDRQNTTVESTKFDRWRFDQTSWRAVHRVDGQPWLNAPITSVDGTTQVSPFVLLGAKTT